MNAIRRWLDPWHLANRRLREAMLECAPFARGRLLDVGCGAQPFRDVFHVERYVGADLPGFPGSRADVFASALSLPFRDGSFETVLCNEVLEHVPDPQRLLLEAARILTPGGHLILTTPQTWGLHHEPYDYWRFTRHGLAHLARGASLEPLRIEPTSGFWVTFAQRFSDSLFETWGAKPKGPIARRLLRPIGGAAQLGGLALERVFGRRGDTLDNVLVARKP